MNIKFVDIQNFRKLKSCRVELSARKTIFVGANNSGKTSAMDVLMFFLKKEYRGRIATADFTLSNWEKINEIGNKWIKSNPKSMDLSVESWWPYLPTLDVWIDVAADEIHYV